MRNSLITIGELIVGIGVGDGDGEGLGEGLGDGLGDGLGLGDGDGLGLGDGEGLGLGVGLGELQSLSGEPVLRGFGLPVAKSAALLSVSVQPPRARRAAVVLLGPAVGPAPSKQFAVLP